jgi:hypothetical protein
VPGERGPADAEVAGDGGDRFAALTASSGDGQDVVDDGRRPTAMPSLRLGGAQPVQGVLADEVAFHYLDNVAGASRRSRVFILPAARELSQQAYGQPPEPPLHTDF